MDIISSMNNLTFPQLSQNTKGQLSLPKLPEIPLVYHVPSKVREKPDLNLAAGAQALRWQSGYRCRRHHTWLAAIGLRRRGWFPAPKTQDNRAADGWLLEDWIAQIDLQLSSTARKKDVFGRWSLPFHWSFGRCPADGPVAARGGGLILNLPCDRWMQLDAPLTPLANWWLPAGCSFSTIWVVPLQSFSMIVEVKYSNAQT